jgi:paired amphipathic helix protein Sin3a
MCKSVLNDEWVSRPSFASEDSGFMAHKKNIYEEALHRSEEERHEYDFHIEAIVKTIGLLDPINNKISQLNPEDRGQFKLKPNFGGAGKSIHHRVIRKIYGREAGEEVIRAMQDSPAVAIPVVLARLKQKEEEWKRAQREWNKVWREVDARNYYKSLDHQGIVFKAADKKATTPKAFINQIEAARAEQVAKRAAYIDPLFSRVSPTHQLEFTVEDVSVLQDTLKLVFSFLDRTTGQISPGERKRVEGFLRTFVPLFFRLDTATFNSVFTALEPEEISDDVGSGSEEESAGNSKSGRGRKGANGSGGGDLRKKLLSEQAKARNKGRVGPSQPVASSSVDPQAQGTGQDTNLGPLFCNSTFYVLLRLLEVSAPLTSPESRLTSKSSCFIQGS